MYKSTKSNLIQSFDCFENYAKYAASTDIDSGTFTCILYIHYIWLRMVVCTCVTLKEHDSIHSCDCRIILHFLLQVSRLRNMAIPIATTVGLFGFFGFAIYPISLELSVEITYPVAEATSSGMMVISGYVGIIYESAS